MGPDGMRLMFAGGFTALGLVFVALGSISLMRHRARLANWRREPATVVGYEWRGASDDSTQHWVIERRDRHGRLHRSESALGTSWGTMRSFPFSTEVLVNPEDEADFVLAGGLRSGLGGAVFIVLGAVFALVGVVLWMLLGRG